MYHVLQRESDPLNHAKLAMAVYGWEKLDKLDNMIQCYLCCRQLGLWNFKNAPLDLENEHRWYCPWIRQDKDAVEECGYKKTSQIILNRKVAKYDLKDYGDALQMLLSTRKV
jgi:hypothetical protein